ncbi:MAG: homocysteine S-methyltransferase family protein [Parachlamydiaceae bacterium]
MKILFGPYGCLFSGLGFSNNPFDVRDGYWEAVESIARDYLIAGAGLPTINAFYLRSLLGCGAEGLYKELFRLNLEALLRALEGRDLCVAVCLGPAEDCYQPDRAPNVAGASLFARRQYQLCLEVLREFGVSNVVFLHETIGTCREALGISLSARALNIPLIVSFVVDRGGLLLDGSTVEGAISLIDRETLGFVEGFSLNCCSPFAFEKVAASFKDPSLLQRLIGFYPNSWDGNPACYEQGETPIEPDKNHSLELIAEIGRRYHLRFIGGCCGFGYGDIRRLCLIR